MSLAGLWESLLAVGRDPRSGGYRRYSFTAADSACRDWFMTNAAKRDLRPQCDRNANLWAWWDCPAPGSASGPAADQRTAGQAGHLRPGAIVTGSHLDSVPDGGAFDGPLGVVSGFAAIDELRGRGFVPARPIAVAAFCEEEGARFGLACLGSRLLTGAAEPQAARQLRDAAGVSLAEAMRSAGLDPAGIGRDDELLGSIAAFVELHIEQGSALDGLGAAVGIGAGIWPHGRWRLDFTGRADHAGTTAIADRRDPMLPYAATVLAARQAAAEHGTLATFGKVIGEPGGANAICSAVHAWLDAGRRTRRAWTARSARSRRPPERRRPVTACSLRYAASRLPRRWSSTPGWQARWPRPWPRGGSRRRCWRPAPVTTPECSLPRCPRRCCSCATRPACRTRRPSGPRWRTARPE